MGLFGGGFGVGLGSFGGRLGDALGLIGGCFGEGCSATLRAVGRRATSASHTPGKCRQCPHWRSSALCEGSKFRRWGAPAALHNCPGGTPEDPTVYRTIRFPRASAFGWPGRRDHSLAVAVLGGRTREFAAGFRVLDFGCPWLQWWHGHLARATGLYGILL
jgi:hypothetical protein